MCIVIPSKIIEIKGRKAKVEQDNHTHWLDISLIDDKINVGDYLLSYQKTATNKLTPQEAKKVLDLFAN